MANMAIVMNFGLLGDIIDMFTMANFTLVILMVLEF